MFICVQEICTFLLDRKSLLSFPSGLEVCGIEIEVCNVKYNFLPAPSFMAVSMSFAEASPEKKEVCSSYDALTNFFFRWGGGGKGGGGWGKRRRQGNGGFNNFPFSSLIFLPFFLIYTENRKCLQFQSLQVWFWNTTKPILISTSQDLCALTALLWLP